MDPTDQDSKPSATMEAELARRLQEGAAAVAPEDLEGLLARLDALLSRVQRARWLRPQAARVRLMLRLLHDHRRGHDRTVPWRVVAAIAAALIYVLDPLDLVPDAIPVMGQLDDLLVLRLLWRMVAEDLRAYAHRRLGRRPDPDFEALYETAFAEPEAARHPSEDAPR